jgi:GDP-L-fucose synthase
MQKSDQLPEVVIWGSGKARREFLYVDDMAKASVFLMYLEKKKLATLTAQTLSL